MEKKRATAAHMRATAKYERENYDKALIRFPRGTLDEIRSTGDSINGFTVKAVAEKLAAIRAAASIQEESTP